MRKTIQLISLVGVYTSKIVFADDVCFVTAYAGQSLRQRLDDGTVFRAKTISIILYQILSGVRYLHETVGVIHHVRTNSIH